MAENISKRIFVSACEHSAELHCAALIGEVRELSSVTGPTIDWVGFGGEKMAAAGCTLLASPVQRAAMHYKVLAQLGYYRQLVKQATAYLAQNRVDLVVVCDSPAFNFHIAKAARRLGIDVLFYVAPQLWAWAPWRIYKLRRCCTKLACILPFEQAWFTRRGVDAVYVSNPLFDPLDEPVEQNTKAYAAYRPEAPRIALMPGSRDGEIETLWPAMLDIAALLKKKHPQATFVACAADAEKRQTLAAMAQGRPAVHIDIGRVHETAKSCDFTLVASGSATLQVAAAGCPMAILYQSNKWLWRLVGCWLIRTRYLSLVNILAGRELVPEYMPYFETVEPIAKTCSDLLSAPERLRQTSGALTELVKPLTMTKASENVARIVLKVICTEGTKGGQP